MTQWSVVAQETLDCNKGAPKAASLLDQPPVLLAAMNGVFVPATSLRPTAVQVVASEHDTCSTVKVRASGWGSDRDSPAQPLGVCTSACVPLSRSPTAVQVLAAVHETLDSVPLTPGAALTTFH